MDSNTKERRDQGRSSHRDSHRDRKRDNSRDRDGERSHRHHRSSRRHHRDHDRSRSRSRDLREGRDAYSDRHYHKKRPRHDGDDKDRRHRKSRKVDLHPVVKQDEAPPDPEIPGSSAPVRDSWMTEPAADFIDYTQKGTRKPKPQPSKPDYHPIIHRNELNTQLKEGKSLDQYADAGAEDGARYTFGDAGSEWRMMKLKRVYEFAKEEGRTLESVALERYGDLRAFDEAREEEIELERRQIYGEGRNDAKKKPTGELYRERMVKAGAGYERQASVRDKRDQELAQGRVTETTPNTRNTAAQNQTALNKMRALLMKAQLRGDPKAAEMEKEYNEAMAGSLAATKNEPEVVVLSAMDSRLLAGLDGRVGREVVEGKRGKLVDKDDMSLDDMVREEKRTRGQDSLDYLDENASRLAKRVQRTGIDLKNMAIGEFNKMQRALDTCPLCQHEDKPPMAPVVALATRVFLTLPTEPELVTGGAVIVPIQHKVNMMECDDDEWEEVRNFMKSLVRMYNSRNLDVIFYENAASPWRKRHAAIVVVPLPRSLGETAPAYFKEAIISSDEEWSQHKKIIDTLAKSRQGLGKLAFRRSLVKEMPYFHVWFEIDGGMGHVIEDENRWPRGDLFAREVLGGMLDADPSTIKRPGKWSRGRDARVDGFRAGWDKFDWTKVLYDN